MATELTAFQPGQVPAHIVAARGDLEPNTIGSGITVPSLSPQGKVWTISIDGQKTKLEKRDNDGEVVPVSVMKVVILEFAKRRGRTYYEGAYDPDKESAPLCWSDDGITPDSSAPQLQAKKCAECPKAVKGSKVSDQGKSTTACSQHRMMALVPAHKLDFVPLRLKIAITSDFDGQSPQHAQQGWFAFDQYRKYLLSVGVEHTAEVITKMKFDPNAAFPKILFAAERWLTPEERAQISPLTKDPEVLKLLGGTWTPAGVDGTLKDETTAGAGEGVAATAPQVATADAAATGSAPAAPAAVQPEADDGEGEIMGLDAPAAKPTQGAAQAGVSVPTAAKTSSAPKAAAAEAQPAAVTVKDPAIAALLADWGGDGAE